MCFFLLFESSNRGSYNFSGKWLLHMRHLGSLECCALAAQLQIALNCEFRTLLIDSIFLCSPQMQQKAVSEGWDLPNCSVCGARPMDKSAPRFSPRVHSSTAA
jgi:hypothetical protein